MKYIKLFFILVVSVIISSSCNEVQNDKLIIGNWVAIEWLINGVPSEANTQNTGFTFSEKGAYTFKNSGNLQTGTYKVENDMLFTTPLNQQEMMVKIAKLTKDSLVFDMNRGGQPETLTLLRK